jgi:phage terminase large subunit-like protein
LEPILAKLTLADVKAEKEWRSKHKVLGYYPDTGPLRRELYPKHQAFFSAGGQHKPMAECCPANCTGKPHRERAAISGNRTGKTEGIGAYEVTLHATGQYPAWWPGRRFEKPIKAWAAGDTSKTVRESIQPKLIGSWSNEGCGMLPADAIVHRTLKAGVSDSVDTIYVRHASGGVSSIVLKSYDQRREGFQASEVDVVWLDEEPDEGVYFEALTRTMTTDGLLLLTMTPLLGMSEVVMSYMEGPGGGRPKWSVQIGWDEVPHLTQEAKESLWQSIPKYQRDARSKGIPVLGSGAIYPFDPEDYTIGDFDIPPHWPRCYAVDVGWNRTAVLWLALNRDTDTLYAHAEHYRSESEPVVHAEAVKARGKWIPGVIDPAARGRSQIDGRQLIAMYRQLGLELTEADNAVEAGIYQVMTRLGSGRLKVFKSCQNLLSEMRLYRRDEKGKVVKSHDHLVDCLRYGWSRFLDVARPAPAPEPEEAPEFAPSFGGGGTSWMG